MDFAAGLLDQLGGFRGRHRDGDRFDALTGRLVSGQVPETEQFAKAANGEDDMEYEFHPVAAELVEQEVRKLAEANPDFEYRGDPSCLYTHKDGVGGCIVGQALRALGRGIDYDSPLNHETDVVELCGRGLIIGDVGWLAHVQNHQDLKTAWGAAVQEADEHAISITKEDWFGYGEYWDE